MTCWFFRFHNWTKWAETKIRAFVIGTHEQYQVLRQQRSCQRCGLQQVKRLEIDEP